MAIDNFGTFWSKNYPYRKFVQSVSDAYDNINDQFELNLLETMDKLSYAKCPLLHKENWIYLDFSTFSPFFVSGSGNFEAGQPFYNLSNIIAGDKLERSFDLSTIGKSVDNIEFICDSIVAPTIVLRNGTDYIIQNNRILFFERPKLDKMWGFNNYLKADYLYDTVGFVFLTKEECRLPRSADIIQLLLHLVRYGLSLGKLEKFLTVFFDFPYITDNSETVIYTDNEVVETNNGSYAIPAGLVSTVSIGMVLDRYSPITNGVTILEDSDYKVKNGELIKKEAKVVPNVYGYAKWNSGAKWNDRFYVQNTDLGIHAVATIKKLNTDFSIARLNALKKAIPVWLNLNIILETKFEEDVMAPIDTVVVSKCNSVQDDYSDILDGSFSAPRWNSGIKWNDGHKYSTKTFNPSIKIIRQPI